MTKEEIKNKLFENHENFIAVIDSLNREDFMFTPNEKWNAGQQLDHIYRAVSALSAGMRFPKALLKLVIGKANRQSRTYDALVERYHQRLSGGGKAKGRFVPKPIEFEQKTKWIEKLLYVVEKLSKSLNHYSEKNLDEYIMPHPLLGKLTVREMMFFTIYHAQHHQRLTLKNLELKNA